MAPTFPSYVMNSPFLKRTIPIAAIFAILFVLLLLPNLDAMFFANTRYSECSSLVKKDPGKALAIAQGWRREAPESLLGKHCEAVALFATRDYLAAAALFMELGKHVTTANPLLSAKLFGQAAEAYRAGGKPDQAKEAEAAALLVSPVSAKQDRQPADTSKQNPPAPTPSPAPKPSK